MMQWIVLLLVTPLIIGMMGQVAQRLILGEKPYPTKKRSDGVEVTKFDGWKHYYHVTLPWHALLVGLLIGLGGYYIGLPVPDVFGEKVGGAMLAYAFSGGVAMIAYDVIVKVIKKMVETSKVS